MLLLPYSLLLFAGAGAGLPQNDRVPPPTAPAILASRDIGVIKAITPTEPGQIGINPVQSDLGDPKTYIGSIFGSDTHYITTATSLVSTEKTAVTLEDGGVHSLTYEVMVVATTTKWIGVNTEYLTITTINPTSTSTVQILVATATVAGNGQSVGDVSLILSEGLAKALGASVEVAIKSCNAPLARRQDIAGEFAVCLAKQASKAVEEEALFDGFVNGELWETIGVGVAEAAAAGIKAALALLSAAKKVEFVVWMAAAAALVGAIIAGETIGDTTSPGAVAKLNIPVQGFGAKPAKAGCDGTEKKHSESPICVDFNCKSADNITCSVAPYIKCPCLYLLPDFEPQYGNPVDLFQAQALIQQVVAAVYSDICSTVTTVLSGIPGTTFVAGAETHTVAPVTNIIGTTTYCNCNGGTMAALNSAVSATSTSTWCAGIQASPTASGWYRIDYNGITHFPTPTITAPPASTAVVTSWPVYSWFSTPNGWPCYFEYEARAACCPDNKPSGICTETTTRSLSQFTQYQYSTYYV